MVALNRYDLYLRVLDIGSNQYGAPEGIWWKDFPTEIVNIDGPNFVLDGRPHQFYHCRYPGCSSFKHPSKKTLDQFSNIGCGPGGNFEVVKISEEETQRLDNYLEYIDEDTPYDIIKMDTQGTELDILNYGENALRHSRLLIMEVAFYELYYDQPTYHQTLPVLGALGFAPVKILAEHNAVKIKDGSMDLHHPIPVMIEADILFVNMFNPSARTNMILKEVFNVQER